MRGHEKAEASGLSLRSISRDVGDGARKEDVATHLQRRQARGGRRGVARHQRRRLRRKRGLEDAVAGRVPKNNCLLLRSSGRTVETGDRRIFRPLIGRQEEGTNGAVARNLTNPRQDRKSTRL